MAAGEPMRTGWDKKKAHISPPPTGGISLLVIFAVLCLTIFALLSLSTVQADARLAAASEQAVVDYYTADCKAQEILAQLRVGQRPEGVIAVGNEYYGYSGDISDNRELRVEVRINGSEYEILRWQAVFTGDWEPDETLQVWEGEL